MKTDLMISKVALILFLITGVNASLIAQGNLKDKYKENTIEYDIEYQYMPELSSGMDSVFSRYVVIENSKLQKIDKIEFSAEDQNVALSDEQMKALIKQGVIKKQKDKVYIPIDQYIPVEKNIEVYIQGTDGAIMKGNRERKNKDKEEKSEIIKKDK